MNREKAIEWCIRIFSKSAPDGVPQPDWNGIVGVGNRSETAWHNEALRAYISQVSPIPNRLADAINQSWAEGKVDYRIVNHVLVWQEDRNGHYQPDVVISADADMDRDMQIASSHVNDIKALEEKARVIKDQLKDAANTSVGISSKTIRFVGAESHAVVSRRRKHTLREDSASLALIKKVWSLMPDVVSVSSRMEITEGREGDLAILLESIGRSDLITSRESIHFDEKKYEALYFENEGLQLEPAVNTKTTLAIRFENPV